MKDNNELSNETTKLLTMMTLMMKGNGYSYQEKLELIRMMNSILDFDINQKYRMRNQLPPIDESSNPPVNQFRMG